MADHLKERLLQIALQMHAIVQEIGPRWVQLGHLRDESRMLTEELRKREDGPRD